MRVPLPISGVSNVAAFLDTPGAFAPPGAMMNVVANGEGQRRRLSARPGLSKAFPERMGNEGPNGRRVQAVAVLTRASALAPTKLASPTDLAGSRVARSVLIDAGLLTVAVGQVGAVDGIKVTGTAGQVVVRVASTGQTVTVPTTANFPDAPVPAWTGIDPTGTLAVTLYRYEDSGTARAVAVWTKPDDGGLLSVTVLTLGATATPLSAAFTGPLLVLAAGRWLGALELITVGGVVRPGATATIDATAMPQVVDRVVDAAGRTIGNANGLWLAFQGTATGGTAEVSVNLSAATNQAITTGEFGRQFRAGVVRFNLDSTGAGTWRATLVRLGGVLGEGSPVNEQDGSGGGLDHQTCRLSEHLERGPRGAVISALAVDARGAFAVAMSNSGWGPNSTFTPGGHPFTTVAKFDAEGRLLWEVDTGSAIGDEEGGGLTGDVTRYPVDTPDEDGTNAGTTNKAGPAVRAVAMTDDGLVYAAGRVHGSGGHCVFCFEAASGLERWRAAVTDSTVSKGTSGQGVGPRCLAVDPLDGQVIAAPARSKTYATTPPWAGVFKFDAVDGARLWAWSITQDDTEPGHVVLAVGAGRALLGGPNLADS